MENLSKRDREETPPLVLPEKEKFLEELQALLKPNKSVKLIATFKAGVIPVILDTLARDTGKEGQEIVASLYQSIEKVSAYYKKRADDAEAEEAARLTEDKKSSGGTP